MQPRRTLHLVSDAASRALAERLAHEGVEVLVHEYLDAFFAVEQDEEASCLLIDLGASAGSENDRRLRRRGLPPVIFLAAEPGDVRLAVELMKRGAADYIEAGEPIERVASILCGHLDRARASLEVGETVAAVRRGLSRLTRREAEVLELVVEGKTSKAIALALGLSKKTVDLHRSHIMHKLDAASVVDLVRLVLLEESSR